MSETNLYQRQWNPRLYLDKYYSTPKLSSDEQAIFQFLFKSLNSDKRLYRRAIEFGCGPTVHHALALAPHVAEIHLADYLPENLAEIRTWLEYGADAHNWDLWLQRILELEGRDDITHSEIRDRADELRRKVTALKLGDVQQNHPLGDGSRYDLVASFFCCEAVTPSKAEWCRLMRNLCRLLEPGGTLVLAAARRCRAYSVVDSRFPTAYVEECDFLKLLEHEGFDLDRTVVRAVAIAPDWSDQGSQSICLVKSEAAPK
ncbi:NNMT/PNMT/TEMT family protein [Gimesia chilikensis]|uniref:NNMT/PNMT/TEMT family protein n=1 Tax=Gimesia chilikensis TaxID=2605989 RepID=A0A517WAZ0_9PLAN|nr:guanitoxin biosynthesis pre-guanitoxin forming N-methyltransferase GntF [Gimesia chilikensis]QDU02423.1 NNMT/PNMT/TEMT family protein [Gimesia chilikensis]